jgi:hypothetical protein
MYKILKRSGRYKWIIEQNQKRNNWSTGKITGKEEIVGLMKNVK